MLGAVLQVVALLFPLSTTGGHTLEVSGDIRLIGELHPSTGVVVTTLTGETSHDDV